MDTETAIALAAKQLQKLGGHTFDVLEVRKPISPEAALNLSKIVSKLSPLVGNLIEFNTVEFLNSAHEFLEVGRWRRQDPGFPDTVLDGVIPTPGFEIKAWFPLATEITARFKDSQRHFAKDNTQVCMLAWLPEYIIFGRPQILDVVIVSGLSVARARDEHYHDPPDYLVIEPENTISRTRNLQQTNTSGHKWQGTIDEFAEAKEIVESWGPDGCTYSVDPDYQAQLRVLMGSYKYRLDTNYAKMDRIVHTDIELFKERVLETTVKGMKVRAWSRLLASGDDAAVRSALALHLNIQEGSAAELLE